MDNVDSYRLNLRIPSDVEKKLREATTASNRSITAEIIFRLNSSFMIDELKNDESKLSVKQTAERIALLAKKISHVAEDNSSFTKEILSKEETQLLNLFNETSEDAKKTLLNSFSDVIQLLTKAK